MTRSQQQNPRRAEGQPEAPQLVAVHALPGQERPLCVWAMRPFDALACEALLEADRLLAAQPDTCRRHGVTS